MAAMERLLLYPVHLLLTLVAAGRAVIIHQQAAQVVQVVVVLAHQLWKDPAVQEQLTRAVVAAGGLLCLQTKLAEQAVQAL